MRTIIEEVNIYKYDELDEGIKDALLEELYNDEFNHYLEFYLYGDMLDKAVELLKQFINNTKNIKVYYDLSYSQGSGAMIEFEVDLKDINHKYKLLTNEQINQIEAVGYTNIAISQAGNYTHERSFNFDYQDYTCYINDFDDAQTQLDNMIFLFKQDLISINEELTKTGYAFMEEYINKDNLLNELRLYEYRKNGERYNDEV